MRAAAQHKCVRDEKICIAGASSKQMEITGRMQNALSGIAHTHEKCFHERSHVLKSSLG